MDTPRFALTRTIETIGGPAPDLLSVDARRALRCITDQLPAGLSNRLYLECRLAADAPRVDLVMCLDDRNRDVVTDGGCRHLPARLRRHAIWQGVTALCGWWAGGDANVARAVTQVWLEFDAPETATGDHLPVPCVFLAFSRASARREVVDAIVRGFGLLRGASFQSDTRAAVARAVERLPEPAWIAYAGLMCSRTVDEVRFCVANVRRDALADYLGAVAWPGSLAHAASSLQSMRCASVGDPLNAIALLHVDVGAETGPRLGAEICFERMHQMRAMTRERDLLDRVCCLGLCATPKRDALLAWPGHAMLRFAHECGDSLVVRRINGIKLVIEGSTLEVKAYLTAFHGLRPSRAGQIG